VKRPSHIPAAVFITGFHPGGTERQMIELIRRLDRARFDVHVACFQRDGAWLPRVEACAPVTAFPIRGFARPGTLAQAAAFVRWCRARRIRVVQTCDLYANTFALPSAAAAGVRVRIGSRRELNPDKTRGQIALQRQAYRFATRVVANSPAAARQLDSEGVPRHRIRVIPNGLSIERYRPHDAAPRVSRLVTVANLRHEKAHDVLLDAIARLAPRHPALRLEVAGDGPRREALERQARTLGIESRVAFLGHREDIPELLARAHAFVLPSRSEAFPNGAIEAMAAGLPVVASAVGGLLDLIENGCTGVLTPPGDPAALANAIDGLIENPARAAALGRAARDEARRYSFDRMVSTFEGLYLSELGVAHAIPAAA
jgi:glycosyltransferase involved in cell wall biosynthesis